MHIRLSEACALRARTKKNREPQMGADWFMGWVDATPTGACGDFSLILTRGLKTPGYVLGMLRIP